MTIVWFLVLIVSLGMLTKGADFVLDAAEKFGTRLGLTSFAAGAIILGSLTSLPDLVAAIAGQLQGASDIVAGTAVGANIADILLIAAIIAILSKGVQIHAKNITYDMAWLGTATAALVFVSFDRVIYMRESFLLLMLFCIYAFTTYAIAREKNASNTGSAVQKTTLRDGFRLLAGFVLLVAGAHFAVEATLELAVSFHIATGVIGLFAIALGTTLPEFFVTIRGVRNGQGSAALGNVFGSNVFNALVVVGIPGLLGPMAIDEITHSVGMFVMVLATGILIALLWRAHALSRTVGILFLCGYTVFTLIVAGMIG